MKKLQTNYHYIVDNVRGVCYLLWGHRAGKKFILGLRVINNIKKPLKIYCDNEPTVQYFYNNKKSDAAKHLNIKYYVVKEKIQDHTVSI
jgi:hypothetical protein